MVPISGWGSAAAIGAATEGLGVPVVLTGSHYTTSVDDAAAGRRYEHLHFDTSSMAHFRAIETVVAARRRRTRAVRIRITVPGHPVVDQRDPRRRTSRTTRSGRSWPATRPASSTCPAGDVELPAIVRPPGRSTSTPTAGRCRGTCRSSATTRSCRRSAADNATRSRGRLERPGHRRRPRGRQPRDGRAVRPGAGPARLPGGRSERHRRLARPAAALGRRARASSASRSTPSGRTGTPAARRSRPCSTSSPTTAGRSRSTTTGRTGIGTCCGSRATIRACRSSSPTAGLGHPMVEGARIAAEADNIYAEMS